MSSRRPPRRRAPLLPALALALLATVTACDDAATPTAPDAPRFARGTTQTHPDGKGIGTAGTKGNRTSQKVTYHGGGELTAATPTVYVIWYGLWNGNPAVPMLTTFITDLGGSSYFAINTVYHDVNGGAPSGNLAYGGSIDDFYSRGASLTDVDVVLIVAQAAAGGQLPVDPNGIYVVFTAADVDVTSGLGTAYCGYHSSVSVNGVPLPFVLVGSTSRSTQCGGQWPSPNGSREGDGMATVLAAELSNTLTDPWFTAWYDKFFLEPADKCAWTYGTTYTTTNGARANVQIGGRDYLLQQLWVPGGRTGACALDLGAGTLAAAAS